MKRFEKIKKLLILILALFLVIICAKSIFAGNTITGTARCSVPYIVTLSSGEKILVGSGEKIEEETNIAETQEDEELNIAENNANYIQQKEEVISEDNKEVELITTVCAK